MDQQGILLDQEQDQFACSICLDLLKEPVTIPCGHSYCSSCIQGTWDQDERKGVFSCPQCRESFNPRPGLRKNHMLAEVVEKLKKTGVLKKHKLVKAKAQLQDKMCSGHDKRLAIHCQTDQQCICAMDDYKDHDTVSAVAERTDKQKLFGVTRQKVQQRVQERENELKELRQALESLNDSAQAAVEDSERIFTELITSIEKQCSEVEKLIRDQQKTAVSQAEGLLVRLEQEIAELKRRDADLEQLSHPDDNMQFVQSSQSFSSLNVSSDIPSIVVCPAPYFKDVSEAVSDLREKLIDILKETGTKISTRVARVGILYPAEPRGRDDFLQYSCPLTLDLNTISKHLSLSEGNREVTGTRQVQPYPDHPERFTNWWQVLCREGLSGRCYWEVEWTGSQVYIAVSYKDIRRTGNGNDSCFGYNNKSWSLHCTKSGYCFRHNNVETKISGPQSSRVGVYLDHKASTLSFYSVSDTMTLLHRVQTTFTQPLYPGLSLWQFGDKVEFWKPY